MRISLGLISNELSSRGRPGGTPAKEPSTGAHRRPTILIVEDEVLIRLTVGEFLREANYRVLECANATEAKAALESKESIELIFTDIHLPGNITGFELADWIRNQYPDVKVLVTSASADLSTAAGYGKERGPVLYKPYALDELLAQVKRLLLS